METGKKQKEGFLKRNGLGTERAAGFGRDGHGLRPAGGWDGISWKGTSGDTLLVSVLYLRLGGGGRAPWQCGYVNGRTNDGTNDTFYDFFSLLVTISDKNSHKDLRIMTCYWICRAVGYLGSSSLSLIHPF